MIEKNELISIIIPVYNVEKYLRTCLESVINQTYTNFEVILIDDGSIDSTKMICLEYCQKDSRFIYFWKENGGASSARNLGLEKAKGKYVFFLDSDDWIEPETIKELYDIAATECVDFVFSEAVLINELTGESHHSNYSYHKDYKTGNPQRIMREMMFHKEFHLNIWSILFLKRFLDKNNIRFYNGIIYEDAIFAYQIYALADKVSHCKKTLYYRRYRENSVMSSIKSDKNFVSTATVYKETVRFNKSLPRYRQNNEYIVRSALNALTGYRDINYKDKRKCKKLYSEIKRKMLDDNAYGDKALRWRCRGYYFWAFYKVVQKIFIGDKADYSIYINDAQSSQKKVLMTMPHMVGGGAERVASQIINQMHLYGIDTKFVLSGDKRSEVVRSDLDETIPLFLLKEEMPKEAIISLVGHKISALLSSLFCKPFEIFRKPVPSAFAKLSITSQYYREIKFLKGMFLSEPDLIVIAFLQMTIPMVLLAAQNPPNRIIISERADPNRLMKKRYGKPFIEKYYTRADAVVFQTEDAKAVYPEAVSAKGTVISNPLKASLPEPYHGERNKNITTFCRISNQKNLPLLVDAFAKVHAVHSDYVLRIIGDAPNDEGEQVLKTINKIIADYRIEDSVKFEPFRANVHEKIIKDAMYVNSSDYEGISNAMLEAMAIGMPVVCTDCPIGGAKATITDGENGLLVPIKDADALAEAINRIISDNSLADKLSQNASLLRDDLSLDKITEKWIELLGD